MLQNTSSTVLLAWSVLCASCASAPGRDAASPPSFKTKEPVQVVASVDAFHNLGAFIDFDAGFVSYHSIELVVSHPDRFAWTRLMIQYQGTPIVNGRRIELGDTLRFTAPVTVEKGCCEPYLSDLKDIQFLDRQETHGDR